MSYDIRPMRAVKVAGGKTIMVADEYAGLGFSLSDLNPLTLAQKIQAGADKIESNIQTATGWLQSGVQRIDTVAANAANVANRVGAGVQGAARGGIASAATGDASSGLATAALFTKPVLVIGGLALALYVFTRHPGHRGW